MKSGYRCTDASNCYTLVPRLSNSQNPSFEIFHPFMHIIHLLGKSLGAKDGECQV